MIWRIYIYTMVVLLALATIGSFTYLVVDPPSRLANTSYGLNRFTTPKVLLPSVVGDKGSSASNSITVDQLIRSYQLNASGFGGQGKPSHAKLTAPTGC